MQGDKGGTGRGRYLVSSADSKQLADFIALEGADPALTLLEKIGPQDAPHTAVFEMPHTTAATLTQRFERAGNLKIEPDRPLSLFKS